MDDAQPNAQPDIEEYDVMAATALAMGPQAAEALQGGAPAEAAVRESPEHALAPPQVKAIGPPPPSRASELLDHGEIDPRFWEAAAAMERDMPCRRLPQPRPPPRKQGRECR